MRGRDIRKYSYVNKGLYLVNTHNGIKDKLPRIDIKDYPAVKAHLDKYWDKIKNRTDKGDTPYNLRSCAYLDDFFKPKIVYPETTQSAYFAFDKTGLFIDKTCFMLISEYAKYLQITLSSTLFEYAYKRIFSSIELGQNGYQYNKHALIKLPIKIPTETELSRLNEINASGFNEFIFNLYNLSEEEINLIKNKKI